MDQRPNYYMLLGLDPAEEDAGTIAKAIQNKKNQWSTEKVKGSPEQRAEATLNLDRVPDIHATLSNPESRREEADGARRLAKEERVTRLKSLDDMIAVLRAGGICTSDDIVTLVKDLGGTFSQAEVTDRGRAAGLSIDVLGAAPTRSVDATKSFLSPDQMTQLRPNLKILGVRTLYEFLQMDSNSSTPSLFQRAVERDQKLFQTGNNNAESNAAKALCAQCKLIFSSDDEKKKYNNSLAIEAMDGMKRRIDLAGRRKKFLSAKQLDELVRQARESGVGTGDARAFVEGFAATRKWDVERVDKLSSEGLRQCGHCSTLAKAANAEHCGKCGQPLTINCPRCERLMPTELSACTGCGFPIGDWNWIKIEVDKASLLASRRQIDEAASSLRTICKNWPGWKIAENQLLAVERLVSERQSNRTLLEVLLGEKKLFASQIEIEKFKRAWPSEDVVRFQETATDGIHRASREFDAAEKLRRKGDGEGAVAQYKIALAICADYLDAQKALANLPPAPPGNLIVTVQGSGFQLRWTATDKSSDSYVVVKKARGSPANPEDGIECFTTRDTVGTDSSVQEGVPWHYAVFSRRDKVISNGAGRSGPHLRTAGVEALHVVPGEREVSIRWRPPNGCLRVEVWRRTDFPPDRPGNGTRVSCSLDAAHDVGLNNDSVYGYLVAPVFENPLVPNATIAGPATTCLVTPTSLPGQITDLRAQREGDILKLCWTDPGPSVQFQIRQCAVRPNISPGTVLSKEDADQIGSLVPTIGPGHAQPNAIESAEVHFIPFSLKAAMAVAGQPISVVLIKRPLDLKADTDGRDIRLTWTWPKGMTQAAVCYSYDGLPEMPLGQGIIRKDVSLEEYTRAGLFTVPKAERRRHYISVFMLARNGELHSEPATVVAAMGQHREFTYRIVRPRRVFGIQWGSRSQPELRITGNGKLPATILVAKPRVIPLSSDDGRKLVRLPELSVNGHYSIPVAEMLAEGNLKAKLFFENPNDVQEIKLNLSA